MVDLPDPDTPIRIKIRGATGGALRDFSVLAIAAPVCDLPLTIPPVSFPSSFRHRDVPRNAENHRKAACSHERADCGSIPMWNLHAPQPPPSFEAGRNAG